MDARHLQDAALMNSFRWLASLKLTLALLIVFLTCISVALWRGDSFALPVAVCFLLLAINLLAAIIFLPALRRQTPLLVFHLCLLAVVLLVAIGRLVYFNGQAEVLEGESFEGVFSQQEAGALHPISLDGVKFVNRGFTVSYAPGLKRLKTRNQVAWLDEKGVEQTAIIGDDTPLILNGYRFYTSWNKGFALLFEWQPKVGEPIIGSVNLPGYPGNALKQAQQWNLPGVSEPVWAMLQFEGDLIPSDRDASFRLPDDYRVVVRHGDQRWELVPGVAQVIELPEGRLRYLEIRTWMGYLVTWDATIPWLLAASTLAVLALAWHFWAQFSRRPWNQD